MLPATFKFFFLRDLDKFVAEIQAFPDEEALWRTSGDIKNPAGNLGLHLAGNLQHFIGALLGGTGYVRKRDLEFVSTEVPRSEILAELAAARRVVDEVLGNMTEADLSRTFPGDHHFGSEGLVSHGLVHLLAHLNYHLGQLNYLRRMA